MEPSNQIDTDKFDKVLATYESYKRDESISREQACQITTQLFPLFTDNDMDDDFLSDRLVEEYGIQRSLGLSIQDSAYLIKISSLKMHSLLNGVNLSLERFVDYIEQELFARAALKSTLLNDVKSATGKKDYRASLTLLEKLYPKEYGPRSTLEDGIKKLTDAWTINIVDPDVPAVEDQTEELTE